MYLLLPINTSEVQDDEPWKINWKAIDSCFSVVEFLKHYSPGPHVNGEIVNASLNKCDVAADTEPDGTILHFANGVFNKNSLRDTVVVAVHTGRIYSILEVLSEMSAESPFEESAGSKKPGFKTHADYFHKK